MALRIETAPARWRRGTTEATCLRVTAAGLREAAAFCGGHTWAASVVVPLDGGEGTAGPGDWIVRYDTGELAVWPDATFRRVWKPVTE